ncbi:MAG: nicotinamide riboside transporter PnuC [Peptostreptococcaceae bacterium]
MNSLTKTKTFDDWSKFEIYWLLSSTMTMIILSIIWKDSLLSLISGITGIIGVVLCAKGKIETYYFSIINVAIYAILCFQSKLYGEVMLNSLYFIPMNIFGFFMWKKQKDDSGTVNVRSLSKKEFSIMVLGLIVSIFMYYQLLKKLGGNLQLIDSVTTITSVVAIILQVLRYKEQWILWIIINIVSIIMWGMLLNSDSGSITMIVMWSAYLINAVYGYVNWQKLDVKEQV